MSKVKPSETPMAIDMVNQSGKTFNQIVWAHNAAVGAAVRARQTGLMVCGLISASDESVALAEQLFDIADKLQISLKTRKDQVVEENSKD